MEERNDIMWCRIYKTCVLLAYEFFVLGWFSFQLVLFCFWRHEQRIGRLVDSLTSRYHPCATFWIYRGLAERAHGHRNWVSAEEATAPESGVMCERESSIHSFIHFHSIIHSVTHRSVGFVSSFSFGWLLLRFGVALLGTIYLIESTRHKKKIPFDDFTLYRVSFCLCRDRMYTCCSVVLRCSVLYGG